MMKMNTKNLGTIALLAGMVFVVVLASAGSAKAAEAGTSDKFATSLKQSLKHYVMALEAYNDGNYGEVKGQIQAAASNAKHADPELADLLEELRTEYQDGEDRILSTPIATEIAYTYNYYIVENGWPCAQFDPNNPLVHMGRIEFKT